MLERDKEFMAAWCGVSDRVARAAISKMEDRGAVHVAERSVRGPWLWMPGPEWRQWAPAAARVLNMLNIDARPEGLTAEQINAVRARLRRPILPTSRYVSALSLPFGLWADGRLGELMRA